MLALENAQRNRLRTWVGCGGAGVASVQLVWWTAGRLRRSFLTRRLAGLFSSWSMAGFQPRMNRMEAVRILNVSPFSSRPTILKAHRTLMIRNHPDGGGSNFIANKINEAKEVVIRGGGLSVDAQPK
eukprot:Lankesteria_metandrocarpae@DN8190_c0_g1_i1.p1